MRVSIIIVSYNTKDLTLQALQSIVTSFSSSSILKNDSEVLVVDNNSNDGSLEALNTLKNSYPLPLAILSNSKNTGFAHANNRAIKQAKGEVIFLLNSDTIVQKDAIDIVFQSLMAPENKSLGILAATLTNLDGSSQPQGGSSPSLFALTNHLLFFDDLPIIGKLLPSTQHTGLRATVDDRELRLQGWVAATAVAIKKSVFDEIGLLDENIFMYGEDVEFCLRAAHHHWKSGIEPNAAVLHIQAASSDKRSAILGELLGLTYIWAKHMPLWQRPIVRLLLRLGVLLRWLIFATMGRRKQANLYKSLLTKV